MLDGLRSPWQQRWPCMYSMPAATSRSTASSERHRLARRPARNAPSTTALRSVLALQNSCAQLQLLSILGTRQCLSRRARRVCFAQSLHVRVVPTGARRLRTRDPGRFQTQIRCKLYF